MHKKELYKYALNLNIDLKFLDLIIKKVLDINSKDLLFLTEISKNDTIKIKKLFKKVNDGYPIEYVIGEAEFYGIKLKVNKNTLIPRNDTEILVTKVINEMDKLSDITLIDIGTGSGNIIIAVTNNCKKVNKTYAIDKSKKALKIAKVNFDKHCQNNAPIILNGELLSTFLKTKPTLTKDIIITANLPYIKNGDLKNMSKETIKYEPHLALFGGENTGFELYKKLIKQINKFIDYYRPNNIILFIEIGFDQYEYSKTFFKNKKLKTRYYKDNSGIYRCVKISF